MRAIWVATAAGTALTTAALIATGGGYAQPGNAGPKARYVMDVSTISGFMGNPMAAILGRGGGAQHELILRLGSSLAATGGAPQADHFMPAGMNLGASVPLETPQPATGTTPTDRTPDQPGEMRKPKGRLLIFWGCGAHAGPGQPIVLDFAKMAAGQVPRLPYSTTIPVETGPTFANSKTFGRWPNTLGRKQNLPKNASLIGDHRVAGNYSPAISFSLTQDFLPALSVKSAANPDGSIQLAWAPVTAATGYYAWIMGMKEAGNESADMVWWTSSARQEFGAGLQDWLSPATVNRLIAQNVVMPPSQTGCQVPAEVKGAAGAFMMNFMYAYGPEQEFAYPPRPANPRLAWRPEWTAKARYRATSMNLIGMPGMGMRGGDESSSSDDGDQPKPRKKKCKAGGLLGSALGLPTGC